jgi:hypothetical protein
MLFNKHSTSRLCCKRKTNFRCSRHLPPSAKKETRKIIIQNFYFLMHIIFLCGTFVPYLTTGGKKEAPFLDT